MAAVDPTEEPEPDEDGTVPTSGRATLRLFRKGGGIFGEDSDDDDSSVDSDELRKALGMGSDDEDDEDDEPNGGPSDPSKSKAARKNAIKDLIKQAEEEESDEDMEDEDDDAKPNGVSPKKKGKAPATSDDEDDSDDDSDDDDLFGEDFVICTLDTEKVSRLFCLVLARVVNTNTLLELPAALRSCNQRG
jgi:FK506-binding nuclear protein